MGNKRLNKTLLFYGSLIIVACSLLFTYIYYVNYQTTVFNDLLLTLEDVENLDNFDYENFNNYRITIIDENGEVLFDNKSDIYYMDNHFSREEITEALAGNIGESRRNSDTVGYDSYYVAIQKNNSDIIRISKNAKTASVIFLDVVPYISLSVGILILLLYYFSNNFTKNLLISLKKNKPTYAEFKPIINKISIQDQKLVNNELSIMKYKNNLNSILELIDEGIFITDEKKKIKIYNKKLLKFLNLEDIDYHNVSVLEISKNDFLTKTLNNNSQSDVDLEFSINEDPLKLTLKFFEIDSNTKGYVGVVSSMKDFYESLKLRQEFSANVTHELKTPLTSIIGYSDLISTGIAKAEDIKDFNEKIAAASRRLIYLIDNILKISLFDETKSIELVSVDLNDVILDVIKNMTVLLEDNQVIDYHHCDYKVMANRELLYNTIENIISNSIKYSKNDLKITIDTMIKDDYVKLEITDNGIGIPKKDLPHIFDRFYTVEKSRNGRNSGLGLAISKHIIELFDGTIQAESVYGKYTKIIVSLKNKI